MDVYWVHESLGKNNWYTFNYKTNKMKGLYHNVNLFVFKLDPALASVKRMNHEPMLKRADKRQKIILETIYEKKELNQRHGRGRPRLLKPRKTQYEKAKIEVKELVLKLKEQGHKVYYRVPQDLKEDLVWKKP